MKAEHLPFRQFLSPNQRPYLLAADEDANLVGMRWYGEGPFHREYKLAINIQKKSHFVIRSGDVIYNKLFAWKGAFGIVPQELDGMFVSDKFPTYSLNVEKVDPGYLQWYFRTPGVWEQAKAISTGSAAISKLTLNPPQFLDLTAPVPPLSEQRRIVAKIGQLASKIEEARGLRDKSVAEADVLFATTCRELFLSGGWPLATVEEIVGQQNLRNGKSVKVGDHPDGIRCLRLSAMRDGRLDYDESKIVPLTAVEAKEYLIQAGDVFVMRGNGSKHLVGRAAWARESQSRTIFPDLLIRIPLGGTPWSPDFFVAYWNCPVMRRTIVDAAKTTSGIWKINQGHIASFHVPLPPLPEQRCIVAYLDDLQAKVDQLKTLQAQTATELDALLPSILDRAFRGEL
jgi:type I restriction enzyme S subunit